MIGRLTGHVLACSPGRMLLDVAGVGYDVHIPLSTYYTLSRDSGSTVSLHVHTHVRAEALQLFGFASQDERTVFELLIGISGVGPKLALAILSGIGVDELFETVRGKDRGRLQKIPGVGKKTAERLLLELSDKLDEQRSAGAAGLQRQGATAAGDLTGLRPDAVSALVNLGYSGDAAGRAVDRAMEPQGRTTNPTLEQVLRAALAGLVR